MDVTDLPSEYWVRFWVNYRRQERQGTLSSLFAGHSELILHIIWGDTDEGVAFWREVAEADSERELPPLPDKEPINVNPNMLE